MAKMKIKPLADRVLVRRLEDDSEQKVGGIIIPDTAKEKRVIHVPLKEFCRSWNVSCEMLVVRLSARS